MGLVEGLLPEQKARVKIDKQLIAAGWDIVSRDGYVPYHAQAIREALMEGSTESDYLLFVENKAIAVVEAKQEKNPLVDNETEIQAEKYAVTPRSMYGFWFNKKVPLVYLANGEKIYFKNLLDSNQDRYIELEKMHSPKRMLQIISKYSEYGALPRLEKEGLRDCQYNAELTFEDSLRMGKNKGLAILATGAGKTYLACLASYRLMNYAHVDRILFLVDRNNLAKQTANEFNGFHLTENNKKLSELYEVSRLRKPDDIKSQVVISTIQKLYAVLIGNEIDEYDGDESEDYFKKELNEPPIKLIGDLKLPPDYFKFIIVDECHRSIYGKWKSVLDYFKDAKVLGLTATPTPEAYAFFNQNIVEEYTYEQSVIDGVNVPYRIYEIKTKKTEHGGELQPDVPIKEVIKKTKEEETLIINKPYSYKSDALDKTIIDPGQIKGVLSAYRDSIYTDLYPERTENWNFIPKTLIFAKNDKHADEIVKAVKEVFKCKFDNEQVPDEFVQKITYSAGDSNQLIRNFRVSKHFRIAVTVTLVATGTDVKPLEVVMFMADVNSAVLFTQMKGRGCRTIGDDKLKDVTPNAKTKDCFYVVDAVGATTSDKVIPRVNPTDKKHLDLKDLLEHISHGELSDENLVLLRDYCSTITNRYEHSDLFRRHLEEFIDSFHFSPKHISEKINEALKTGSLPVYISPSYDNSVRFSLVYDLISNADAKDKLLELKKGYLIFAPEEKDELINKGFSFETAKTFIEQFEKYLNDNKDKIEALDIIYNSKNITITHSMLVDLYEKFLNKNRQYTPHFIWRNYKTIDKEGDVTNLDTKYNVDALTNLIQIVRYAFKKDVELYSLHGVYAQRFNLYAGNANHNLTEYQIEIMRKIADYIIDEGAITANELNGFDTDLWRAGISNFGMDTFSSELQMLSKYLMRS